MKKILFLLLLPSLSFASGIYNPGSGSSGSSGGGTSTLGVNYNGVSITSPTVQINFLGSGVNVTASGSTATVTINGDAGISAISGNFAFGSTSTVVLAICTAACAVTLPTAVGIEGKVYQVKVIGSGATSITTTSAQTMDGSTTVTPLPNQYSELNFKSDNANWNIF